MQLMRKTEKELIDRVVATMVDFGTTYAPERDENGQVHYKLSP